MISKEQEQIDRLEKKIEELQKDYAVLKYCMEKESLNDQLMKIFINNVSQQLPQLMEMMGITNKAMEIDKKQE